MKALVLYESFFGNTQKIAEAVAKGLTNYEVSVLNVKDFKNEMLNGIDLFIVGSATRAFRPCELTKAMLKNLPENSLKGKKIAAFDTRLNVNKAPGILKVLARFFGFAAEPIQKSLTKAGGESVLNPEGFWVKESEGPLAEGELEKATKWAQEIK